MVVPLFRRLRCYPGLLQKVILDEAALDLVLGVEADLHEPAEAGRVVVPNSLCITCREKTGVLN